MKKGTRKLLVWLLAISMAFLVFPTAALADDSTYADTQGHWAQTAIDKWSELGILQGQNGKFRPDAAVTRGELAIILDRVMQYQTEADSSQFTDLGQSLSREAILRANAAGVLLGSGGKAWPQDSITRQEAVVMIGRALGVQTGNAALTFADADRISAFAKDYVAAMAAAGYIHGSSDGKFNPAATMTRAQLVTILNNAVQMLCSKAQTYTGEVAGSVVVNTPGAVLKDMKITGDLILAEGIGSGDVTLENVTVQGSTIVRGGGVNSIHIQGNSQIAELIIEKTDAGGVRIVTADGTEVAATYVDDGTDDVILTGSFKTVTVRSDVSVKLVGAKADTLNVTAENANLNLDQNSSVSLFTADVKTTVQNLGAITKAQVNADGVVLGGNKPATVAVASSVTVKPVDANGNSVAWNSSSSSGGGSSSPAIALTQLTAAGPSTVTFNSSTAGAAIYFNGTQVREDGSALLTVSGSNTITVPLMTSGASNTLALHRTGYVSAESTVTYTAPYDTQATLGAWEKDRTEPESWTEDSDGWITLTTQTAPSNNWYAWHGKKSATGVGLTDGWMMQTQMKLTQDMLDRDGIRASVWLQVEGSANFGAANQSGVIDWAILQFKKDSAQDVAGWQAWNSTDGSWETLDSVPTTPGTYTLTMIYSSGTLSQYIDGVLVNQYDINPDEGVSAPTYVMLQSYSFGDSYSVQWKEPAISYTNQYPADAQIVTTAAQLQSALTSAQDGAVIYLANGTCELSTQVDITKPVTLIGIGSAAIAAADDWSGSDNSSKHLMDVYAGTEEQPVTFRNITFDSNGKAHGIQAYRQDETGNAYLVLDDVSLLNSAGAGLTVNGATVKATELQTSGNAWGSVNVDPGSGVSAPSLFILVSGTLGDSIQIWSDGKYVTETATAEANVPSDYTMQTSGNGWMYSNQAG